MAVAVISLKSRKSIFSHMLRPRWALLWLVLFAVLTCSCCQEDKPRYCGEKLAEMLDMYCNGTFTKFFYVRRRRSATTPTQTLRPQRFRRLLRQLRTEEQLLIRQQKQLEQAHTPLVLPQQLQSKSESQSQSESVGPAAGSSGRRTRREGGRRNPGVVDECCDNGCTYADILYYCR